MTKTLRSVSKLPLVSVVMSVYDGERYLREAIDSILGQTFKDFEFIIINDGSTDDTLQIIKSYKDPRIVLISRENKGLVVSLNEGIQKAKGKYIARQDADDVSMPERLEKQVKFLNSNLGYVVAGSNIEFINEEGDVVLLSPMLIDDPEIRLEMLIRNSFGHSSVMYKRDAALNMGLYDKDSWPAEDYDLWVKLGERGKYSNINSYLVRYRINNEGISQKNAAKQRDAADKVRNYLWQKQDLPKPMYSQICKKYSSKIETSRQQKARLIEAYRLAAIQAWRRNRRVYAFKLFAKVIISPSGMARLVVQTFFRGSSSL